MRDRVIRYRANPDLSREHATARISAYVYGNILIFASIIPLSDDDVHHWHAVAIVLGVAASTYLAHVFADLVAQGVTSAGSRERGTLVHELRDATPILTSAFLPTVLLGAGALEWVSPRAALTASLIYLFIRLGLVGLLVERLRSDRPSLRTFLSGLGLALVAAVIAAIKVLIAH